MKNNDIELRYLQSARDDAEPPVLQWRKSPGRNEWGFHEWEPWQDVPTVYEERPETSRTLEVTSGVSITTMAPQARDLLDKIIAEYSKHYDPERYNASPDDVHQFAYWLVRYSGLIKPA